MKASRLLWLVIAVLIAMGGLWLRYPFAKPPETPATREQSESNSDSQAGGTSLPTTSPADPARDELADRVLASYHTLTHLKIRVESTHYWWHADGDSLAIDVDHFPPPPRDVEQTSAPFAIVEVDSTPVLHKAALKVARQWNSVTVAEPFLEFEVRDGEFLEKNLKTGQTATFNDQTRQGRIMHTTEFTQFGCETAMWVPPLVGKDSHQGKRFAEWVKRGRIVGEGRDHAQDRCTVVLADYGGEFNYFWVNADFLVTQWIKVFELAGRLNRVAYVKRITIEAAERKEGP